MWQTQTQSHSIYRASMASRGTKSCRKRFRVTIEGLFTAYELNWTKRNSIWRTPEWTAALLYVFRTGWALTVLDSLQPIRSWRWRALPTNTSCNWVDQSQPQFTPVQLMRCEQTLTVPCYRHTGTHGCCTDWRCVQSRCDCVDGYENYTQTDGCQLIDVCTRNSSVCHANASCSVSGPWQVE